MTVERAALQQGILGTVIRDAALFHHNDLIRTGNGAQTMRNDDQCPPLCQPGNSPLDHRLVFWIHAGRGLVQNDDWRVFQHRPSNGDALFLTTGEVSATAAADRIIALRKCPDKFVAARR